MTHRKHSPYCIMESSSAQKEIKADKKRSVFFIVFCSVREKRIKSLHIPACMCSGDKTQVNTFNKNHTRVISDFSSRSQSDDNPNLNLELSRPFHQWIKLSRYKKFHSFFNPISSMFIFTFFFFAGISINEQSLMSQTD